MKVDLDAVLRCASEAVRAAGAVLAPRLGRPGTIRTKPTGPVSEMDIRAEAAIVGVIRRAFPGHAILSEEMGAVGTALARWIADPLDGTSNFARGIPWYDVSLAFELEGRVEVGVVYAPALDLLFSAVRGHGTRLNDRSIQVSDLRTVAGSMVDVGFTREHWADPSEVAKASRLAAAGAEVRSLNACGLDLGFVAAGWLEGYWDPRVAPWDHAAGALLVAEAGGRFVNSPKPDAADAAAAILASNGHVHDALSRILEFPHGGGE